MNPRVIQVGGTSLQTTGGERHLIVPRVAAGLPLLAIGLAHVFDASAPMRPLVDAAGLPAAALLSPIAVAIEIVAGALLLAGLYARIGSLLALPVMVGAIYAHLVIDVWPNAEYNEPPIALPIVVLLAAAYVLVRGAGAWSLDHALTRSDKS